MKSGKCPKCGSDEIYKSATYLGHRQWWGLTIFSSVRIHEFICCDCGLVETYLRDMADTAKVKEKCAKQST
jgi:predicted RNA-binding Zn-ribbon protein involved in translation (DUF1610 family)